MNNKLQQARDENTPPQVLLKLIRHYPQTVLDNSTFAEVIRNSPKFLAQLSRKSLLHLLKQDRVPVCFLEWLADSQDKKVLLALLRHSNTPLNVLEKLSESKFTEVVEEVKLHINWRDKIDESLEEILFTAVTNADIEVDRYKNCYSEKSLLKQLLALGIVPDWTIPIFHETTKLKLANNNDTPAGILSQLCKQAGFDIQSNLDNFYYAIAKHLNIPSSILEQLISYESKKVKRLVISHPTTSLTTIREHYHQHQAITSLDINPEELRELAASKDLEIRLQIARNSKTPEDILVSFPKAPEWQLRLAVAFNLNTPVTTLEELIKDSYWEVRWAIAQNFSTPESLLQELLNDKDATVKDVAERRLEDTSEEANKNSDLIIASNLIPYDRDAPDRISREDILATEMEFAHNAYVETLDLSKLSDVVRDISNNNWNYCIHLLNENTPVEILQQLADSEDKQNRSAVAYNQFTPTEILNQLANDESEQIRIAVAENPNSTEEILNILADDDSKHVKNTVICNPNISLDILQKIIKQEKTNLSDESIDCLVQKLLTGLEFTDELLNLLTDIDRLEIQTALARLDNIPSSILERLVTSENWQVKELVARNKNVFLTSLETLLQDNYNLIQNTTLEKLLEKNNTAENDFIFQWNIVHNPDSDTATIDNLVNSKWLAIRIAVASSANTSSNILEQLARDSILDIRLAVASNINTLVSLLDDLLTDNNIEVVEAVINNPSFPIERLEELAADKTSPFKKFAINSRWTSAIAILRDLTFSRLISINVLIFPKLE